MTFCPPLSTILSPAWSNDAARPAGAGSAGAAAWVASRVHGLAGSAADGRGDLAADQRVRRLVAAAGQQETGGGHQRGQPEGE